MKSKHLQTSVAALAALVVAADSGRGATLTEGAFHILGSDNSGGADHDISVYPGNSGFAGTTGANGAVTETFNNPIVDYRFFHGEDETTTITYANGAADLISDVTGSFSEGYFESIPFADVWETSDPGAGYVNAADFTNPTGTGNTDLVQGTLDISGLSAGSVYFFFGGYRTNHDWDITMSDTDGPGVDIQLLDVGNNDFSNNNEQYVFSVDFENDAGYDTISYSYAPDTAYRGRFVGVVVTAIPTADSDGDGLDDLWEDENFGDNSGTVEPSDLTGTDGGAADFDGDGATDEQEYGSGSDPKVTDTDGDNLSDGDEINTHLTSPVLADTDGDTLNDDVEVAGPTSPLLADTDGDGLRDDEELVAGEDGFITDPTLADTDSDGAEDWYEIVASFTDPTIAGDKPNIPYPLPDPGDSTGSGNKPVKVYILSGQSNMVGYGRVDGSEAGTLETLSKTEGKFPNLVDDNTGLWTTRDDVLYRGVIAALGDGPLGPGFAANSDSFGPELGFGHVMGWHHAEPVLIIKSSQGGRALGWDFLPPGSVQYTEGSTTYAGYGDSPASWPDGTTPTPTEYYGGYQFDQCFLDEADWPGASTFDPVFNVTDILDNFGSEYPDWAAQGFEIAGFVWWHGWNDGLSYTAQYANHYEQNMAQFIREIRDYYEGRYPGKISQDAPFVLATAAFEGWDEDYLNQYPTRRAVIDAQLAVSGETGNYPEFAGNVKTMEARGYWRDSGPSGQGYHYNHHAETFLLTGDALGRAMVGLLGTTPAPGPMITSITVDSGTVTINFTGKANTTYTCKSSQNLGSFPTTESPASGSLTTGDNGDGTFSVDASPETKFYRLEE